MELKEWAEIRQLEVQIKIWQPKELKVLNVLRLSVKVFIKVFPKVLADVAVEVLIEILAVEVLIKLTSGTELVWIELIRIKLI